MMAHKTSEYDDLVEKLLKDWKAVGLSIAIVQGDEIWSKAYGLADLSGEKCTEDTIFDLASTSKTTTAAAVACLVDDENFPDVQWTTPVSQLLPDDFVLQDAEATKNVTIEDILSHRSGMPRHDESYLSVRAEHPDDAKSMTRNLRNLPFNEALRTTYQYNNIMYTVATHLVETVSGKPYETFVQQRLWNPLDMTDTYHELPPSPAKSRLATGYVWDKSTASHVTIPSFPEPEGRGAGRIFSTASSYAKWIRALLRGTVPLSAKVQKDLVAPRTIVPRTWDAEGSTPHYAHTLYALGLEVDSYRGVRLVGHGGAVNGFKAHVAYLPERDWGVVMLGNADDAYEVQQVLLHTLLDGVLGVREGDAGAVDWPAFWRAEREREEREEKEKEDDEEFKVPEQPEGLGVAVEELVGRYFNAGYKGLVLEVKDGKLVADGSDRGFPWVMTFTHLTGPRFVAALRDVWGAGTCTEKMKAKFRFGGDGKVGAVGVAMEPRMEDHLIWFDLVRNEQILD